MPSATSTNPFTRSGFDQAGFDPAAYERAVEGVHARVGQVPARITALRAAARAGADEPGLPDPIAAALLDLGEQIAIGAEELLDQIGQLLQGAAAPILLFGHAGQWVQIRGRASDVQGRLRVDQLPAHAHWKGVAADRYVAAIATQSLAAGRVAGVAGAVLVPLGGCAMAGLAFYVTVGAILVEVIEGLAAAVVAFGSEAFSWAGLLLGLETVEVAGSVLIAAVASLVALLGTQAHALNVLRSELVDHSQFPGGYWPSAVADTYTDATVTDGDAEWSVQP